MRVIQAATEKMMLWTMEWQPADLAKSINEQTSATHNRLGGVEHMFSPPAVLLQYVLPQSRRPRKTCIRNKNGSNYFVAGHLFSSRLFESGVSHTTSVAPNCLRSVAVAQGAQDGNSFHFIPHNIAMWIHSVATLRKNEQLDVLHAFSNHVDGIW